ncbi:MAG: UDP-glucuronic acid decarboxylase family protein [Candidatus Diapherotrites archaeon]
MNSVLVTGGAGFIGSHLCDALIEGGNKVVCIDNLITGKKRNISHLIKNKNFKFIKADICKPLKFKEGFDEIFNLASVASPVHYQNWSIETLMVGSIGTKNMLDLAVKNKTKFLHTSTSEVYGDPSVHPQPESYWGNVNPIGLRSSYDESKRFSEALIMAYYRKKNLDTKIVRIFNTYGPRMDLDDGRVVPNFIMQALKGKPLTVYGSGKQTRSFCYISDMVEGLLKMMDSNESGPINLGNPGEFTILELAQKLVGLTKSKSKIVFRPLPADDATKRRPDISKAKKLLHWEPTVKLDYGLALTINYFKSIKSLL